MNKLIILRGYPGSGKTTIGKQLAKLGHGAFIDHNAILTFIAETTGDDDGIYDQISALELAMTDKLLGDGKSVIVARGFSTPSSLDKYLQIANKQQSDAVVLRLQVSVQILAQRVTSPERKNDFNPSTTPEALHFWVAANPLENVVGEHTIDAESDVNRVIKEIISILK